MALHSAHAPQHQELRTPKPAADPSASSRASASRLKLRHYPVTSEVSRWRTKMCHMDTLEAASAELHEANVRGWYIGTPSFDERHDEWQMYAFDPAERPRVGHRSREWTAVHPTQIGVIRSMAHCLRRHKANKGDDGRQLRPRPIPMRLQSR